VRVVVLLSLLGLSVPAVAKKPTPTEVTLAFGWQPGWKASVTTATTKSRNGAETSRLGGTAALDVVAAPEGALRLDWHDATSTTGGGADDPGFAKLFEGLDVLVAPDELVRADGAWGGFADPVAIEAAMHTVVDRLTALIPKQAPEGDGVGLRAPLGREALEQFVTTTMSPQVLTAKAAQRWSESVSSWTGLQLDVGDTYVADVEQPPAVGQSVRQHTEFVVQGFAPCHDGRKAPTCVRIHRRIDADPTSFRELMRTTMSAMLGTLGGPDALAEATAIDELDLLVEPATVRPWHAVHVKSANLVFVDPAGTREASANVERMETTWSWR
jgi:hypothetical protein